MDTPSWSGSRDSIWCCDLKLTDFAHPACTKWFSNFVVHRIGNERRHCFGPIDGPDILFCRTGFLDSTLCLKLESVSVADGFGTGAGGGRC